MLTLCNFFTGAFCTLQLPIKTKYPVEVHKTLLQLQITRMMSTGRDGCLMWWLMGMAVAWRDGCWLLVMLS
jgi:hypothetical protein